MRQKILAHMEQKTYRPLKAADLAAALGVAADLPAFTGALSELVDEGQVMISKKKRCCLCRHMGLISGRVEGKSGGNAFFVPAARGRGEVYLPAKALHGAIHNDRVLIRIVKGMRFGNGLSVGEVVRVLERANERITGVFHLEAVGGVVFPEDRRLNRAVAIAERHFGGAEEGDVVVAEVTSWPTSSRSMKGKVREILCRAGDPGTDMERVLRKYQLQTEFPEEVLSAAAICAEPAVADFKERVDLRETLIVTVDGADAKDLDDAVSLHRDEDGRFHLGVHIADVAHYVAAGSPLDREAYRRGTSVYFPDRVLPMLPPALSNGVCSLHPQVERLTLSCFMEIDGKGRVIRHELAESVIRSAHRLTYEEVNAFLNEEEDAPSFDADLRRLLTDLDDLRRVLKRKRKKRGALTFHFAEAKVILDERGEPIDIVKRRQDRAEGIIEECMIVANETVAAHCTERDLPLIYRVHDGPDDEKALDLAEFIAPFGYELGRSGDGVHPRHVQRLLAAVAGKPEQSLLELVALRTMSHAHYTTDDRGHFGLASRCYCHFTSPIRRYPDLCVHRVVKAALAMAADQTLAAADGDRLYRRLNEAATQSSYMERNAEDAEREALEAKMALYMAAHVDEEFDGIINGVRPTGFFVELENTINGFVDVVTLAPDEYEFHEHTLTLLGKKTRACYRLGDAVRVKVLRVSVEERLIDFEFIRFIEKEGEDDGEK